MVLGGQTHHFIEHLGHIDIADALNVHILLDEHFCVPGKLGTVGFLRSSAHTHDRVNQGVSVLNQQRLDCFLDEVDILVCDVPDHPEIDPIGLAVADQDVALVRISMECAHIQHLMQVTIYDHTPDPV